MSTGMILDGVLGSEAIDSSGEVLDVKGADISDVEKGTCLLNWEHAPGEKGPDTIVGVVLAAKKIYKREDCENDRQRKYWDEVQLPFIYGVCRLYDGAGHEQAKAIAAIIRDHAANDEPIVCRYSVEGATLRKEDNKLSSSVVRRVAVTVKPCNRTAVSGLIEDPNAPAGFDKKHVKGAVRDLLDFEETEKSEFADPSMQRLGKAVATLINPALEDNLAKTYTAGVASGAPSTLTGGAAMQVEDLKKAKALLRVYKNKAFNRAEFRSMAKMVLPEASDEFLDHFSDMAEDFHVKRGQLQKKEAEPAAAKPATPKAAATPKPVKAAAPKPEVNEEDAGPVNISHGTIRGVACMPNKMKGVHFDEEKGILHTQKGSFPLYNPDKGFEMKEDGAGAPHYEGGVLHVAKGTDTSAFHNGPNPGFREVYNSEPIEEFHSQKVMPNWVRNHEMAKTGRTPDEVVMHAAVFSMLSPNTPVRPHELMYSHMVDTWEDLGIDPRDEHFKKAKKHWLNKDQPKGYPRLATDYFKTHEDVHLGNASEAKGREKGDLMSFMLGENKFANIAKYHKLHNTLTDLVRKHGHDARSATAELMQMKQEHGKWKTRRQVFKSKVKQLAAEKLGLKNHFSNFVDKAVERARAKGLMGQKGESRTGDTKIKKQFEAEAKKRGLKNDLDDYAEKATQSKIGDYKGTEVPGLAPKTGRFTFTMLGGGNSFVPDTHIIRHLFGMDNKKDGDTLAYLKSVLWNPNNHHVLEGVDKWYAKNHPAAQLMQNHPQWGQHFQDDKEQANFPAFWRHWCSIAQDERNRGMPNVSANEFSTHEPFWLGIQKFVKSEAPDERMVAKMIAMHDRYQKDYGEIPAQMMFFHHILPHLWEAAEHRQRHDDLADFAKALTTIDRLGIELRKSAEEAAIAPYNDPMIPTIHDVHYRVDGNEHRAGRFVIHNNRLTHLEDHRGLLQHLLPEGPVTLKTISAIHGMKMSPHLRVSVADVMVPKREQPDKPAEQKVAEAQPVRPPSVFEYHRAGHDHPHTLEVKDGHYMLDGEHLSHPEVQAILENHKSGAATIRYRSGGQSPMEQIQKMEEAFAQFLPMKKADGGEFTTEEMVNHARRMESMGHVPKGYSDALNKMLHEDTLTPGIGNKAAAGHFLAKQKPGVYVSMDGNDFGKVNKAFGQHVGDQAITAMGGALRSAADEATPGVSKVFRNGGDEFVAHFPSHEHAAKFMRAVNQKLQDVPAIGGAHKLSFSFGLGTDMHQANHALLAAKQQKIHPTTGQPLYGVGQTPNLAHSLVPGHEGPLPVHDPEGEMMHQTMKAPASATPKPIPAPPAPPKSAAA